MLVLEILPAGQWPAEHEIDHVLIDYDRRFRRRIVLTTEGQRAILIDQPQAVRLRDGDGLVTEAGVIRVRAQPEDLMEIHAHDDGEIVRIAWHLGNRHLPVQFVEDRIRIRADHVIGAMVEGLGGHVETIQAPFDPEAGAYSGGGHHHHHGDDDGHHH
jgi:urease accessory protein